MTIQLLTGDVFEMLATLPDASVQMCVTSPPYWGLRSYLPADSPLKARELGQEKLHDCLGWATGAPCDECYVCHMVAVFREVWRVLRDDGICFLNLGDSFANDGKWGGTTGGKHVAALHGQSIGRGKRETGLKPKDLCGIPWRVALALQADGWWLRSDIIWHKLAPMPESVTDRPTRAHEFVFLLAKSARYFWDGEAVKTPKADSTINDPRDNGDGARRDRGYTGAASNGGTNLGGSEGGANLRDVWTLGPEPYSGAHYATYVPTLARLCIQAGSSVKGACPKCGAPWIRVVERTDVSDPASYNGSTFTRGKTGATHDNIGQADRYESIATGWRPSCVCGESDTVPCVVLDPFSGSGTTGRVCLEEGRDFIGIDLDPRCTDMAVGRIGMFAEVT